MPTYRTGNGIYSIQMIGEGSTGFSENTAGAAHSVGSWQPDLTLAEQREARNAGCYFAPLADIDSGKKRDPSLLDQIKGKRIWLEADVIETLASGTGVDQAPDLSSCGRNGFQATSGNRPKWVSGAINGLPAFEFDGIDDYFNLYDDLLAGLTEGEIFTIVKIDADPTSAGKTGLWAMSGADAHYPYIDGNIYEDFGYAGQINTGDPTPSLASWRLYNVRSNSSAYKSFLDGAQHFSAAGNVSFPAAGSTLRMGATAALTSFLSGRSPFLLVVDHVLTDDERALVHSYVTKYALTIALGMSSISALPFGAVTVINVDNLLASNKALPFGASTTLQALNVISSILGLPFGASTTINVSAAGVTLDSTANLPFGASTTLQVLQQIISNKALPFGATTVLTNPLLIASNKGLPFGASTALTVDDLIASVKALPFGAVTALTVALQLASTKALPFGANTSLSNADQLASLAALPFGTLTTLLNAVAIDSTKGLPFGAVTDLSVIANRIIDSIAALPFETITAIGRGLTPVEHAHHFFSPDDYPAAGRPDYDFIEHLASGLRKIGRRLD